MAAQSVLNAEAFMGPEEAPRTLSIVRDCPNDVEPLSERELVNAELGTSVDWDRRYWEALQNGFEEFKRLKALTYPDHVAVHQAADFYAVAQSCLVQRQFALTREVLAARNDKSLPSRERRLEAADQFILGALEKAAGLKAS